MGDDSHAPQPGDRIGRYRIERELGRGGMGVVYEATDEELERPVALKLLPSGAMGDAERRARFLREARSAAAVTHRNIAVVHDVGEDDGRVFLAMELIAGETLAARIDREALSVDEALWIAGEIAAGLAKAHQQDIVHRDLKPSNVMLDEDGGVKILDFGLAKRMAEDVEPHEDADTVSAITTAGAILGTPGYMAPEQAEGQPVHATADVFAFGTMLYEMLTGRMAFGGASTARRIAATLEKNPEPVAELTPDVPDELTDLVNECLAKDPSARPANGEAVLERLEPVLPPTRRSSRPVSTVRVPVHDDAREGDTTLRGESHTLAGSNKPARRPWWLAAAVLIPAAAVLWWAARSDEGDGGQSAPSPAASADVAALLAAPETLTGCPVFEVTGQEGSPGRLGAAAAHTACGVWELFTAGEERTKRPATLLELPKLPVDDFPVHAFADDARARSLKAAAGLALTIDGHAVIEDDGVTVTLELKRDGGTDPVTSAVATDRHLLRATRTAVIQLAEKAGLDPAAPIPAGDQRYFGSLSIRDMVAAKQQASAIGYDHEVATHCEQLAETSPILAGAYAVECGHDDVDEERYPTWPRNLKKALEKLPEPGRLFWSSLLRLKRLTPAAALKLAERISEAREKVSDDRELAALAIGEALVRFRGGSPDEASALLDRAAQLNPHNCDARITAFQLSLQNTDRRPLARTAVAWCPASEHTWTTKYFLERGDDRDLDDIRTGYYLTDHAPRVGLAFGEALIAKGQLARARNVASRYLSGRSKEVGHYLLGIVEVGSGNIDAGLDRLERLLENTEVLGEERAFSADVSAIYNGLEAAQLAGREQAFADLVLERFVLAEPPAVGRIAPLSLVLAACFASKDVALRAAPRIEQLMEGGQLWKMEEIGPYLDGALALQRGDAKAAAEAWRPLVPKPVFRQHLLAQIFDEAGESELAWTIDEHKLANAYSWTSISHARQARRAEARGDTERARELAKQYVDAFGAADVEVPLIDEMRKLSRADAGDLEETSP